MDNKNTIKKIGVAMISLIEFIISNSSGESNKSTKQII
jgi:hypothetical protein